MPRQQFEYQYSQASIEQLVSNFQNWVAQQGYSTEYAFQNNWHVVKVVKGKALWKGHCEVYIGGSPERFNVIIDSESLAKEIIGPGGLIGMGIRGKIRSLVKNIPDSISHISGAQRIR